IAGTINLERWVLRWRAERLLTEIRSLELRKSTFADAREVMGRWRTESHELGPCRPEWCDIEITLNRDILKRMDFLWKHRILASGYRWLGGRPAIMSASIRVRNNQVVRKSIDEHIGGECNQDDQGQSSCVTLIGHVDTGSQGWISALHPEYRFWT